MPHDPVVIIGYSRTPMGGFQGDFTGVKATELGAQAVRAAVERSGVRTDAIDRVYMGCVLPATLGQAPARQATLGAGLPQSVEATTVNKMCGSGMQAAIMGYEALAARTVDVVVTGGMESMTNAPYALAKHRGGARIGHDSFVDTMMLDGLEDAYEPGKAMGVFAEEAVRDYQFTREQQDEYALRSLSRAKTAIAEGWFTREITPVTVATRGGDVVIDTDEQPAKARPEKIPQLKPAFVKDGTVTPANSSSISDGAAALVLTRQSVAEREGLTPIARIVATASHAQAPNKFASAPVPAIRALRAIDAPLIAAVNGTAAGGGMSLVLACDLVLVSPRAKFVPAYPGIGLSTDGGMSWSLQRAVGPKKAMQLLIENRPVAADEAERLGIATSIVADEDFDAAVLERATAMARLPRKALGTIRALIDAGNHNTLDQQLDAELAAIGQLAVAADAMEGLDAFSERRKPVFAD